MFKADITINFASGAIGARVIFAATQDQAMDDAQYYVRKAVFEGRKILEETGNDDLMVEKFKVMTKKDVD